jgi:NAD(P)-dependent dehydrogenase (short-subunit alcohol dehydrogenase family)
MSSDNHTAIYPSLRNKTIFISGGATGIGAELVRAFTQQGARVGFVDIDETSATQLVAELAFAAYPPVFRFADVRDLSGLNNAISAISGRLGSIDVLINNAANDQRIAFDDLTPDNWDDSQAVNLRHHVFASQQIAQQMKLRGQGVIINFGSVSWLRGNAAIIGYATAKAAIHGFTRCLARELGPSGIRVNSLMPGAILTEKQARLWRTPEETARFHQLQALPIDLLAKDVASMALFLAADDSRGVTGQNLIVDAGLI